MADRAPATPTGRERHPSYQGPPPDRARLRAVPGGRDPSAPRRTPGLLDRIGTAPALGVVVGFLCVFGLVMVGSASPLISLSLYGSAWSILIRQILWMSVGTVLLLVLARVDYRKWRTVRAPLLLGSLVLLVAVLTPHLGVTAGGSSRWINLGPLQLQPSELAKLAFCVFAADLLTRREAHLGSFRLTVAPLLVVLAIFGALILKQPDMGTALVLCCIAFGVLFMGGVRMRPILRILGGIAVLAVIVGIAEPYRRDRILSFLNPSANRSGAGYQVWQSLIGLGSGHLFGLGLGGGRQKWGLLPNAHTDFIFSVVGEELGLVGAVFLVGLFVLFAWLGLRTATRAPERFGSLLAVGITTWLTSQAVINIGAVIGVLPVTGIPLPFISFGGTALIINMAAVGILLNIARHERPVRAVAPARRRPART